jgi:hypothetical protein
VLIGAGGGSMRLLLRAAWALLDPRRTAAKTKIENADFISHYRWFGGLLLWLRIIYAIGIQRCWLPLYGFGCGASSVNLDPSAPAASTLCPHMKWEAC